MKPIHEYQVKNLSGLQYYPTVFLPKIHFLILEYSCPNRDSF